MQSRFRTRSQLASLLQPVIYCNLFTIFTLFSSNNNDKNSLLYIAPLPSFFDKGVLHLASVLIYLSVSLLFVQLLRLCCTSPNMLC